MTDTLDLVRSLTDDEWAHLASKLLTGYFPTARPDQIRPDGDWAVWMIQAGRGWGKTRTGAEDLIEATQRDPGDYFVAAPTFRDMRNVCVEGSTGLLKVLERRCIGHLWNLSNTTLTLANGSRIVAGSADEPDRWRGPNFRGGWCDELAAWRRPDAFTQLQLATRIGDSPRIVVTTTPRPTALVRRLVDDPSTLVTRGRTRDNEANLSPAALAELERQYGGTRLGRQELEGELLTDTPGALVQESWIDHIADDQVPDLRMVVTGLDPAVTSHEDSDESGIVTAGVGVPATDDRPHLYVLGDSSGVFTPEGTAQAAAGAYHRHEGNWVVGEVNNGGDWIGTVIRQVDSTVAYRTERASRGKDVRAQSLATLYEQGRVHHVGQFGELERQLCEWFDGCGWSPDRMDALVWAEKTLMSKPKRRGVVVRDADGRPMSGVAA